jgi:hypothetical protein
VFGHGGDKVFLLNICLDGFVVELGRPHHACPLVAPGLGGVGRTSYASPRS